MSCGVSDWTLRIVWLVDRPPAILPPLHLYLNTNQGTLTKLAFFSEIFCYNERRGRAVSQGLELDHFLSEDRLQMTKFGSTSYTVITNLELYHDISVQF